MQGNDDSAQSHAQSLIERFVDSRPRLRRAVELRLDRRLLGRVDASDVLQEAYLDMMARAEEYQQDMNLPVYLWFRSLTLHRLQAVHRRHLRAKMRDVRREIAQDANELPEVTAHMLASHLLSGITSPSSVAVRMEQEVILKVALENLSASDREVIAMRQFEDLSNDEVALVLGVKKAAASARHVRALEHLREILKTTPGFQG